MKKKEKLQALIEKERVEKSVKLYDQLTSEEVQELLQSCNCLCLPSIEKTEAFGLVLLEAMYYSKPIVASNIEGSGVPWVVEDGVTGILVPPGDSRKLAEALNRLAIDPEMQAEYGRNGRKRLERLFQIKTASDQIGTLYQNILATGKEQ